jgi:hypothetical protein
MDGVDKDKVKQVVYEMSKGSRFFENETRKENTTKERVERLKQKASKITAEERAGFQKVHCQSSTPLVSKLTCLTFFIVSL